MNYQLTTKQQAWLEAATPEQTTAFLSKGPAEVPPLVNRKTGKAVHRPMVRGVLVEEDAFPTYDAALAKAEERLAEYVVEAKGTHLDERALGLDDAYRNIGERLEENSIRIDWAVPLLALSDALPDVLEDWVESLDDGDLKEIAPDMPGLARIFGEQFEREDDEDSDERPWDKMERAEMFAEAVREDRLFGVLIQASQPVRSKLGGGSFSFSWGHTWLQVFYGDTLEAAMEKAIAWGENNWTEKEKEKPATITGAAA